MLTNASLLIILEIIAGAGIAALLTAAMLLPRLRNASREREASERELEALRRDLESVRRAAELAAKEDAIHLREELDAEVREKRRVLEASEEKLEARRERLESREIAISAEQRQLLDGTRELAERQEAVEAEFRRVSGLSQDEARDVYLARIEDEFRDFAARRAREVESQSLREAERRARQVVLDVMERSTIEYVTEATVAVVNLPNEEMKGRIIGREGRNIRAFEQVTGVDLIVDETPEAVVISCFDPVRRETARLALMNLMVDGRIHPGRIEELYEKAQIEVKRTLEEAGERAAETAQVAGLPAPVIETMGHLRFRTSYAQNVLDHSVEVAHIASNIAAELGLNADIARQAGFLHDIGKALGSEWPGPHALTGMEFLRQNGIRPSVLHAVGAHHRDLDPETPEALAIIVADSLSAARPGARRENLDNYVKRLSGLESLANSFPGVERSYAVQAGREIRLIVRPETVDDLGARRLAGEVARRIESEMEYPGQIRVTVIRETRAQDIAK